MTRRRRFAAVLAGLLLGPTAMGAVAVESAVAESAPARPISVVGAEAVFPLAVAAGERFSVRHNQPMPVVERSGTALGFTLFCAGKGPRFPDIAMAERRATRAELDACSRSAIAVDEVLLGHQAVVLAQTAKAPPGLLPPGLTRRQIFLALAAEVPIEGKMVANPYRLWSDIDFTLPVKPIAAFGPPPTSPLWDAFVALVMVSAADEMPELGRWSPAQRAELASKLRGDGVLTLLEEDETSVAGELARRPGALGIVSYNFFAGQAGKLRGLSIDGVAPGPAAIAEGRYAPARGLYLYVKRAQLAAAPGLKAYLAEITGPAASGPGGYLTARGLVPLR